MKVNLNFVLKDEKGNPVVNDGKELKSKDIIAFSLLSSHDSQKVTAQDKFKRYETWKKLGHEEYIDLACEEISKIKEIIGEIYPPIIVGQLWDLLEGN